MDTRRCDVFRRQFEHSRTRVLCAHDKGCLESCAGERGPAGMSTYRTLMWLRGLEKISQADITLLSERIIQLEGTSRAAITRETTRHPVACSTVSGGHMLSRQGVIRVASRHFWGKYKAPVMLCTSLALLFIRFRNHEVLQSPRFSSFCRGRRARADVP